MDGRRGHVSEFLMSVDVQIRGLVFWILLILTLTLVVQNIGLVCMVCVVRVVCMVRMVRIYLIGLPVFML